MHTPSLLIVLLLANSSISLYHYYPFFCLWISLVCLFFYLCKSVRFPFYLFFSLTIFTPSNPAPNKNILPLTFHFDTTLSVTPGHDLYVHISLICKNFATYHSLPQVHLQLTQDYIKLCNMYYCNFYTCSLSSSIMHFHGLSLTVSWYQLWKFNYISPSPTPAPSSYIIIIFNHYH